VVETGGQAEEHLADRACGQFEPRGKGEVTGKKSHGCRLHVTVGRGLAKPSNVYKQKIT